MPPSHIRRGSRRNVKTLESLQMKFKALLQTSPMFSPGNVKNTLFGFHISKARKAGSMRRFLCQALEQGRRWVLLDYLLILLYLTYFNALSDEKRCQICNEYQGHFSVHTRRLPTPHHWTRVNPTPRVSANLLKWHEFKLGLKSFRCVFLLFQLLSEALFQSALFSIVIAETVCFSILSSFKSVLRWITISDEGELKRLDLSFDSHKFKAYFLESKWNACSTSVTEIFGVCLLVLRKGKRGRKRATEKERITMKLLIFWWII